MRPFMPWPVWVSLADIIDIVRGTDLEATKG
jgi:hypothetical protein